MFWAAGRLSFLCYTHLEGHAASMAMGLPSFSQKPVWVCAMESEAVFPGKLTIPDRFEGDGD